MFHLLEKSLHSMKNFSVGDFFFWASRWIIYSLILKAKSYSSLERLDPMLHPVKGHSLSTYSFFALNLQSFPEILEFFSYQEASSTIQLCESGGQPGWMEGYFYDFRHKTILVSSQLLFMTICKGCRPYPSFCLSWIPAPPSTSSLVELGWGLRWKR